MHLVSEEREGMPKKILVVDDSAYEIDDAVTASELWNFFGTRNRRGHN